MGLGGGWVAEDRSAHRTRVQSCRNQALGKGILPPLSLPPLVNQTPPKGESARSGCTCLGHLPASFLDVPAQLEAWEIGQMNGPGAGRGTRSGALRASWSSRFFSAVTAEGIVPVTV